MLKSDLLAAIDRIASEVWPRRLPKDCGVYVIVNKLTRCCYIGTSTNLRLRLGQHKTKINTGSHENQQLNEDAKKLGLASFSAGILVSCGTDAMFKIEREMIACLEQAERYNVSPGLYMDGAGDEAKTQKQRSAEFRARLGDKKEVRGIYAPIEFHDYIRSYLMEEFAREGIVIATKRAKEKA
jgi:group I intron endonuclease